MPPKADTDSREPLSRCRLFECNEDQTGNKWMQYATDVVAVIFVADASAYDVLRRTGVDAATGEEVYSNKLLESLESFKKMWVNPMLKKKSVILLLNKQDLLEVSLQSPSKSSLLPNPLILTQVFGGGQLHFD